MSAIHLPADVDEQCRALCEALNTLPGIKTVESCCGHGERPFRIWFEAHSLKSLPLVAYHTVPCHVGFFWNCRVTTDCAMSPVLFLLESIEVGEVAYEQAGKMATALGTETELKL